MVKQKILLLVHTNFQYKSYELFVGWVYEEKVFFGIRLDYYFGKTKSDLLKEAENAPFSLFQIDEIKRQNTICIYDLKLKFEEELFRKEILHYLNIELSEIENTIECIRIRYSRPPEDDEIEDVLEQFEKIKDYFYNSICKYFVPSCIKNGICPFFIRKEQEWKKGLPNY